MNKREYLIGLGLAGERGRLSKAAKAAITDAEASGTVFDTNMTPVKEIVPETPVRDLGEDLVCYTRGGYIYAFDTCRMCKKNINYCRCDFIAAPALADKLPANSPARIVR